MKSRFLVGALVLVVSIAGCYHASIDTGKNPSGQVIKQSFASSWIYGLVPPKTVETAARCPNGVAKVETRLSFVNQLVGLITLGIYTPMEITVTCAEAMGADLDEVEADFELANDASPEQVRDAFALAARKAAKTGHVVYVRFGSETPSSGVGEGA